MKHVPALCTAGRILLLPWMAWQLLQGDAAIGAVLLVSSGVLGFIQQYTENSLRLTGRTGTVVGLIVDKMTQAIAAILLAFRKPGYWWIFAVVLAKDLIMLALGSYVAMKGNGSARMGWAGNVCNLLFYVAVAVLLYRPDQPVWALGLAVACIVASAFSHLPGFVRTAGQRYKRFARKLQRKEGKPAGTGIKGYAVFAIGIVPLITLAFASQGDPLLVNLSVIGNEPGHRTWFILWGILCAVFFVSLFQKTFELAGYQGYLERCLLLGACLSFVACVLTPFMPEKYPCAASWHNVLAVLAPLLVITVSLLLSIRLRKIDRKLHHNALLLWGLMTGICAFLMGTTGISGLFECVLVILVGLHTYHILARLNKLQVGQVHSISGQQEIAVK